MDRPVGLGDDMTRAVFADCRTIRFAVRVDPHGRLEVASNTALPDLILGRDTAGRLGRLLTAFEETGTLVPATPSRDALAAAVEDHAAQIDRLEREMDRLSDRLARAEGR